MDNGQQVEQLSIGQKVVATKKRKIGLVTEFAADPDNLQLLQLEEVTFHQIYISVVQFHYAILLKFSVGYMQYYDICRKNLVEQ